MRIAVVATPRSGNMWLRRLLVALFRLEERSAHTPAEVDWNGLPERCVLQLHWHRTPPFRRLLERNGFSTLVIARHPLDVLVSILHFAQHEPATSRWLDGEGGDESAIFGADPASRAFLRYATGRRASALLSITPEWWPHANARVRYEQLLAEPVSEIAQLADALGAKPERPAADALAAAQFADLQEEVENHHVWQGRPGLWSEVVPTDLALEIAAAQPSVRQLGYTVGIDSTAASVRWRELAFDAVADEPLQREASVSAKSSIARLALLVQAALHR